MNDELVAVVHRYMESVDSVEAGCTHTATGLIKKIEWIKNDTPIMETTKIQQPQIELVKNLTLWQKIKKFLFTFEII